MILLFVFEINIVSHLNNEPPCRPYQYTYNQLPTKEGQRSQPQRTIRKFTIQSSAWGFIVKQGF